LNIIKRSSEAVEDFDANQQLNVESHQSSHSFHNGETGFNQTGNNFLQTVHPSVVVSQSINNN